MEIQMCAVNEFVCRSMSLKTCASRNSRTRRIGSAPPRGICPVVATPPHQYCYWTFKLK